MRKITYLIGALFFIFQASYSQDRHSRITINNIDHSTVHYLSAQGIDLRCGAVHENNRVTLDISDVDRALLDQLGVSYQIRINDLSLFYAERAERNLPAANIAAELESNLALANRNSEMASRGSISNATLDNYLQYNELNEKDWTKPANFELGSMGGCYTISEVLSELDQMRSYSVSNGLNIVSVKQDASPTNQTTWGNPSSTITNNGLTYTGQGTTRWDPQTIYYVRITGNESSTAEGTKPQILLTSMIHSREVNALMNNMYFMWYLIENYNTDLAVKNLVDNNELYFVPVVNPDGLRWNEHLDSVLSGDGGGMQRKNLRPNTGGTTNTSSNRGVDLNRNFDYFWGSAGIGSSGTPSSDAYRGPSAASEPETQIMVDFISNRNFQTGLWNHTFANSIPHPYGGNPTFVSGREDEMHQWHEDMTKYNRYVSGATIFTPANGIADDWMVGGNPDGNGSVGSGQNIIATTPEHGGTGFWPDPNDIIPIAKRSVRISFMTAYYGGKYAKFHDLTQSDITSLSPTLDFGIERIGQTPSDFTLTLTPISSNITNIVPPAAQTGMGVLEQRIVSAGMTLDPSIQPNDKIEFTIALSNDDGIFYEATIEKYYQPNIIFSHNPDTNGLTGWNNSGWSSTTADAYSNTTAIRTGNAVPYANGTTKTLSTSGSFDLSSSNEVLIQFYSKWDLERNFDFVELQASTNGTTWVNLNGKYTKPSSTASTNDHANKPNSDEPFQGNNSSGHLYDGDRMDKWVMEEIVIDASNNASIFGASNVSFRFRMRSDSGNNFENYSANGEGFFIDDFKIISIQVPCETNVPTGLVASSVLDTSATLTWDAIPSATYDLRYRETGTTTWNEISDISTESFTINGLTELTEYEVQVRTRCSSSTSAYSTSIVFTTLDIITCSGTLVNTFPYEETFDSGIGDWTQAAGDDGDWIVDAGGTPSGNTGPSNDITGVGNYLFLEASTNGSPGEIGSNATAILESPCFDLNILNNGFLTFNYHLFGADQGTLNVEITNDDGNTWTNIFSIGGDLGNTWNSETIDLSTYNNQIVKLRFVGTTGNGFASDMAIDQINLSASPTGYCNSAGTNFSEEYIGRVQVNTIDNSSTGQSYSDFTSISTYMSKNTQYTITITPVWPGGSAFADGYAVWVDFNRDGDFADSGELVFSQSPTTAPSVSGNFTIPSNIPNGATRMRVAMKWNAIPTPCETFQYGEVEDYTINLYNGLLFQNNNWTPNAPTASTGAENALVLDGIFNANIDFSVSNITVNNGATLNLNKANAITVNGNVANNGQFILNSDSNEFSSLIVNGTVSGDIVYNRHANSNANGNDLLAPPVSGEAFTDFLANNTNVFANGDQTLFLFGDFEKPINEYQLFSNLETKTLTAGTGYRVASTDNGTFMFNGTVTTAPVNLPIERSGTNFAKWNLIGNPYPSYIRLSDFLAANITELDSQSAAVYGYDGDNSNGSIWTIWNLAYSDANPGTLIAPGQGFFVSSKSGGANITFTPSMRTSGSSDDFISGRNANSVIEHGLIEIQSGSNIFRTDLYLTNNASLSMDLGYDAEHFGGAPTDFSIFTRLPQDNLNVDLAVQSIGFNDVDSSPIIPLGVNLAQGQQATISLTDSNLNTDVYLEDTHNNSFTLLSTTAYTFTADAELTGIGRFYIRFEANALSNTDTGFKRVNILSDDDKIIVEGQLTSNTDLYLYDIQGRLVLTSSLNINTATNVVNTPGLASGVYLVTLKGNTSTMTKKIVLR